ncbi:cytochrome P450 [Aspergillus fijiensis CBS 313.89]|uniref:Cytochrome P450 n=1 Tax=Aspergillus fijiensis CBS 313.89 TaxID=1448319 RepID=A0A8G1RD71_9EURO|nr:cytochrome P450 [Aspergillus fijiensis CBS 313.89]RAK71135.1 cytochrome P450 [Aspergillus fijiensis CBS 313.89]
METPALLTLLTLLTLVLSLGLYHGGFIRSGPSGALPLPPGPGLVAGLTALIQQRDLAPTFHAWSQAYGPVVHFKIGTRSFIILGTRQVAQELLEKRASIYSSRPPSVWLDKYLHQGLAAAFMPYGHEWRLNRRLHMSLLNYQCTNAYRRLQDIQSKQLMHSFLPPADSSNSTTPKFSDLFYQYTANVMFTLVYGKGQGRSDTDHTRLEQINEMAVFILQAAAFWTNLLDLFPILDRLIPARRFLTWRTKASALHEQTKAVYQECTDGALSAPCWNWSHEITTKSDLVASLPWEHICYSLGELYVAGIHTTKMVLENFVLASLLHPATVKQAQHELDAVVGASRLPTFADIPALPYLDAVISELLRWRPISPIGVPHAVIQEDEYLGYRIPKGATVIANQWGFNMDEEVFEEPQAFQPQRYVEDPGLPVSAFGFGRRLCPGYRLARASLFIVVARLLWGFDILRDEGGEEDEDSPLSRDSDPGSVKAKFCLRSEDRKTIIEKEWEVEEKDERVILEEVRARMVGGS